MAEAYTGPILHVCPRYQNAGGSIGLRSDWHATDWLLGVLTNSGKIRIGLTRIRSATPIMGQMGKLRCPADTAPLLSMGLVRMTLQYQAQPWTGEALFPEIKTKTLKG